jgi:DNA invertase Pin-like site-specific DNA recombinase
MSRDIAAVDLLGRYSNPDNVARLRRVLAGQGRDRPSRRPVPSVRQKQTRLTDSQRSELLTRYLAGESATALATELGINRATAFSSLRRAGVQSRYRILGDDDIAVARQMYEAGQSLAAIGEHFGVADRTVLNVFRRAGVPTRGPGANQWSPRPSR